MRRLKPTEATRTVAVPTGATVVWAGLTWLAGEAAAPQSVDSVDLMVSGMATTLKGENLPMQCTGACPVARWSDVTTQLADGGRIAVDGIDAALKQSSGSNPYPVAGWTLTVIWVQPGADTNTVEFRNDLTTSSSDSPPETTVVLPAGDPITQLDVVVWAADPYSTKSLRLGESVLARDIDGVVDSELQGKPIRVCAGFDLVRAGGADGVPLDAPSAAVSFVNQLTGTIGDTLWIGSTFVVRTEQDPGLPTG